MAEQNFTPTDIARVFSYNPGLFVREFLPTASGKGFGSVEPGYIGSLTILDLKTPYAVTRESIKTKCGWSPFEGFTFPGSVKHTILQGKVHNNYSLFPNP